MRANMKTQFFTYSQNNAGGFYKIDKEIGHFVIVEAISDTHSDDRAGEIIDFSDGCPCCGSRWMHVVGNEGDDVPSIEGKTVSDFVKEADEFYHKNIIFVHYLNGDIVQHEVK